MKAPKNLEGIFVAVLAISSLAALATAQAPVMVGAKPAVASVANANKVADANLAVVVVKAKRLTLAEKAALN